MPHLLIAWDGSTNATHAVRAAASLMPGARATVLTAWRSTMHLGFPLSPVLVAGRAAMDQEAEAAAQALATAGSERATELGLAAAPATISCTGAFWHGIVEAAQARTCDAIVVGLRGTSGIASLVMGSTSHGVSQHASVPVLVVPLPSHEPSLPESAHD
jgi:nucleotide-binding universal stress UspA family protein